MLGTIQLLASTGENAISFLVGLLVGGVLVALLAEANGHRWWRGRRYADRD